MEDRATRRVMDGHRCVVGSMPRREVCVQVSPVSSDAIRPLTAQMVAAAIGLSPTVAIGKASTRQEDHPAQAQPGEPDHARSSAAHARRPARHSRVAATFPSSFSLFVIHPLLATWPAAARSRSDYPLADMAYPRDDRRLLGDARPVRLHLPPPSLTFPRAYALSFVAVALPPETHGTDLPPHIWLPARPVPPHFAVFLAKWLDEDKVGDLSSTFPRVHLPPFAPQTRCE